MNIRQLQIFTFVARQASFTGAARALNMAQPAISIAIRKLEEELDLHLFNRADKKVQLTAEGEVLYRHAERLLEQFQAVRDEMGSLQGLEAGEVRFATTAMLGSYFFPRYIGGFRKRYPGIRVQVFTAGTQDAKKQIDDGLVDMGVVTLDDLPGDFEAQPLLREEVVACVAQSHPLAKAGKVSFEEFLQQDLVLYRESYYLRQLIVNISEELNVTPNIIVETEQLGMIMRLVHEGEGITIALRSAAENEAGVVAVPFRGKQWLNLGIGWKRGAYLSRANQAFLAFLQEEVPARDKPGG